MTRKKINIGYTNKNKMIIGDHFYIEKSYNKFNHLLNYQNIQKFTFVPRLIKETRKKIIWQKIEGKHLEKIHDDDLPQIASHISTLHNSQIKLPKNNLLKRVNYYLKKYHHKKIKSLAIEKHYDHLIKFLNNIANDNPCHNDLWFQNLIKDHKNKIWIVDWEYATMGNRHFDLAFFVESMKQLLNLTPSQEKKFLKLYQQNHVNNVIDENKLHQYRIFVNWFNLLWAYCQEKEPFDLTTIEKKLLKFKIID